MIDVGTDYALVFDENGLADVDTTFATLADPARGLLFDLLKRITCGAGVLWWAPLDTTDVSDLRNSPLGPENEARARADIQRACDADPRFDEVDVQVQPQGRLLRVFISALAEGRPITLVAVLDEQGRITIEEAAVAAAE